jgi:hypothetical protein
MFQAFSAVRTPHSSVRAWKTDFGSYGATLAAGSGFGASDPFTVTVGGAGEDPSVPPQLQQI